MPKSGCGDLWRVAWRCGIKLWDAYTATATASLHLKYSATAVALVWQTVFVKKYKLVAVKK
ncbi:MAG: hypothetical protein KME22_06605 [Hassallia sp. WJT32-NPBG1]|nr:hypothetical protein [Hassallia sp. WJT32-NPBG1]